MRLSLKCERVAHLPTIRDVSGRFRAYAGDMATAVNRLTSTFSELVRIGFLDAEVLPTGAYTYTVTERGMRYYLAANDDDRVAALLQRMMLTGPAE